MPLSLEITSPEQIKVIANALKQQREALRLRVSEFEKEINDIGLLLQKLEPQTSLSIETIARDTFKQAAFDVLLGYDSGWSWRKKAEYMIRNNPPGLTTAQIADKIVDEEPTIDRRVAVRGISVPLSTMPHVFTKIKNAKGDFVYGIK